MTTKTSGRDTILDLIVNMVPLAIILLSVVVFALINPSGPESFASRFRYTLLIVPFMFLAALTCSSGKAVAGSEKKDIIHAPGRATVPGAKSLHEEESEGVVELEESPADDIAEATNKMAQSTPNRKAVPNLSPPYTTQSPPWRLTDSQH